MGEANKTAPADLPLDTRDGWPADLLLRQLRRHLDDEEDLIIPLILDRTEAGLGVA